MRRDADSWTIVAEYGDEIAVCKPFTQGKATIGDLTVSEGPDSIDEITVVLTPETARELVSALVHFYGLNNGREIT